MSQSDWNVDELNGQGGNQNPSGITFDPSDGWIINLLYWWYNAGKLRLALADPVTNKLVPFHDFDPRLDQPGDPSLSTPNIPTQLVVDNDGTAETLEARLGGMQYSTYGAKGVEQSRDTYGADDPGSANVTTSTNSPVDPTGQTGDPLYMVKRESGEEDLELRLVEFRATTDQEVFIYFFDEWDPATALDSNQSNTDTFRFNDAETKPRFDRSATGYSAATAVFRGMARIESSGGNSEVVTKANIEDRVPIGAARVVTAVHTGNNATVSYIAENQEGY